MINEEALLQEVIFKAIRSSGSGGQHVNKVSSKVELSFNVLNSLGLTEEEKERIINKLQNRISKQGVLVLQCQESRSQHKNKEIVINRFIELIRTSIIIPKKRKKTKTPKAVIQKRLKNKKTLSEKKANRKKPDID